MGYKGVLKCKGVCNITPGGRGVTNYASIEVTRIQTQLYA